MTLKRMSFQNCFTAADPSTRLYNLPSVDEFHDLEILVFRRLVPAAETLLDSTPYSPKQLWLPFELNGDDFSRNFFDPPSLSHSERVEIKVRLNAPPLVAMDPL